MLQSDFDVDDGIDQSHLSHEPKIPSEPNEFISDKVPSDDLPIKLFQVYPIAH